MHIFYFHNLPVYRLERAAYYADQERRASAFVDSLGYSDAAVRKQLFEQMKQHDHDKHGPWDFNEIIGHVRLHFMGSQVRGEYFCNRKKRHTLTRTKVLLYSTHKLAPELDIRGEATNEEILNVILEYVEDCRKEEPRRHFDDRWLRNVGPFVDWRGILRAKW